MPENLREGSPGTKPGDVSMEAHVEPVIGTGEAPEPMSVQAPDSERVLFLGREQHDAAAMYPLMRDEVFDGLCESLREIGLADAIVLHDGKVLEGRNRCRAIERLRAEGYEIEPRFVEWKPKGDETPHDYVVAVNSNRRHLTPDQQAAAACKYLPVLRQQSGKRQAATRFKAGHQAAAKKSESPQKRDSRAKNANSAAGQLAVKFGISQHMANQAVALEKAVSKGKLPPAAIEEVLNGVKISKVLARVEEDKSPPTPRARHTSQPLGIHADNKVSATLRQEFAGTPLDPTKLWGKPVAAQPEPSSPSESANETVAAPQMSAAYDLRAEVRKAWEKAWPSIQKTFAIADHEDVKRLLVEEIKDDIRRGGSGRGSKKG